jgi:hypothetical protein
MVFRLVHWVLMVTGKTGDQFVAVIIQVIYRPVRLAEKFSAFRAQFKFLGGITDFAIHGGFTFQLPPKTKGEKRLSFSPLNTKREAHRQSGRLPWLLSKNSVTQVRLLRIGV